jgi:hypothetical protein
VYRKFIIIRCIAALFGTSLSGYALVNVHEQQQTISMRSNVREWTHVLLVNTPCSRLHNFCATGVEQRPSNQGDLDSSVTGVGDGKVYYTGVDLLLISFLYRSTWLLLGCVLNGTLCIIRLVTKDDRVRHVARIGEMINDTFWSENSKERDNLGDPGVRCQINWTGSGQGLVEGCCEHGNELSGSIDIGDFLTSWETASFWRRTLFHGVS